MDERLIGREREVAQLDAQVAAARSGHGSLVLLAGEAGVGKTALARLVLGGSGLAVLDGVGVEQGAWGASAYGPIAGALRSYLRSGGDALPVPEPLARHLALLLPELGPAPPAGDTATLFEAIRSALAGIASRRPLAVFLDDLHQADDATLGLLPLLARWIEQEPLLLLGAYRSDEIPRPHPIRRLRSELRRARHLREVVVEPLGAEASTTLLERVIGAVAAPSLRRAVSDRTGGLPFFIEELGLALAAGRLLQKGPSGLELHEGTDLPVPESVRDAILLRADGLPDEARAAVLAASVAGQVFDPELVVAVSGISAWPDEPLQRGIVREAEPGRMAFRHALIRDAFYGEVPWARRLALHRAIAQRLQADGAPHAIVAEHWARGREPDRARRSYLAAAEGFGAAHAYRDGARAIRRALELWPEGHDQHDQLDALEHLARYEELAGDLGEAVATWREVVEGCARGDDPARLGAACRRLAGALELQGRWEDALAARERAAAAFSTAGSPADAASERIAVAVHLRSAASFEASLRLLRTAKDEASSAGRADLEARVLGLEGNVRVRMGQGDALELVRAGLTMALEGNFTGPAAEIYQRLADSLEHAGDYPGAEETYQEAWSFCAANSLEPTAQLCLACFTVVLRHSGDWDRAIKLCRQVIASPEATMHARTVATGTLGSILGARGQVRQARPLLLESSSMARHIELAAMELLAAWGLALTDQVAGAHAIAVERCQWILERWRRTEERHYVISPLRWATTFLAGLGDGRGARACAAALAQIAADAGQDEAMSALSHALGELALLDGNAEQAVAHFGRALELLSGVGTPFERAESQRRAAAALALVGRCEDAVEHLVGAHRTARRLGAKLLVEQAVDGLAALGERPERRLGRGAAAKHARQGLTHREVEIIRLVAVGLTNREIARQLFLSPRTVEMHVRNALAKLDCRSRADAARRASELGLLTSSEQMTERT
jgi:DNA-binding CsgD family transcriptional regulator